MSKQLHRQQQLDAYKNRARNKVPEEYKTEFEIYEDLCGGTDAAEIAVMLYARGWRTSRYITAGFHFDEPNSARTHEASPDVWAAIRALEATE